MLGTAINQDGRSSGLTAPNGPAQTRLLAEVAAEERLDPGGMALIAIHGTGTPLGDPIEVNALGAALAGGRGTSRSRLAIGAVKSCYGHTEGTAGLTGAAWTASADEIHMIAIACSMRIQTSIITVCSGSWPIAGKLSKRILSRAVWSLSRRPAMCG